MDVLHSLAPCLMKVVVSVEKFGGEILGLNKGESDLFDRVQRSDCKKDFESRQSVDCADLRTRGSDNNPIRLLTRYQFIEDSF